MCYYEKKLKTALNNFKTECNDFIYYESENKVFSLNSKFCEETLDFYRSYVATSTPLILRGACKNWPATSKWNIDYFMDNFPNKEVRVDVTPNGLADGITKRVSDNHEELFFVYPEEQKMTMKSFLQNLKEQKENYVCYIQSQNSNLHTDFDDFFCDVGKSVQWADKLFDKRPDAVNFWMGDDRAVSSLHKDPYENIYFVIDGYKDFMLIPPTDLPYVPYEEFPIGTFKNVTSSSYEIEPTYKDKNNKVENFVEENADIEESNNHKCGGDFQKEDTKESPYVTQPWIPIDPLNPDLKKYPEFQQAKVYHARLMKGDCLYLPALWFHHVRQSHGCIAVNYWYDMDYDVKYCYYELLKEISGKSGKLDPDYV